MGGLYCKARINTDFDGLIRIKNLQTTKKNIMFKVYKNKFYELPDDEKELIDKAISVRQFGYSTKSGAKVGAALKTKTGEIFTGVNVSNVTSTLNVHAEVAAACNAVGNGFKDFKKIAVVPFKRNVDKGITQCGVCLQFLSEFSDGDFKFIVADEEKKLVYYTFLNEIFPMPFKGQLKKD